MYIEKQRKGREQEHEHGRVSKGRERLTGLTRIGIPLYTSCRQPNRSLRKAKLVASRLNCQIHSNYGGPSQMKSRMSLSKL